MFNKSNKNNKEALKKHQQVAISYENDKEMMFKKSEKRAWLIAGVFSIFSIISWIGLYLLLPLKEVTPYVIRVDNATGIPDVVTAIDPKTLTADEALDRYFVNMYIQDRESYTYQTIQKTYEETQLFSTPEVAKDFRKEYDQPDSLDQVLGKGTAKVKVISITLEKIKDENTATARITVEYNNDKDAPYTKHYSIRLTYEYKPETKLNLSQRIDNPVGFFVTSYQRVEENI